MADGQGAVHSPRYESAIRRIDAANAEDPTRVIWRGEERVKELLHAELMTRHVLELDPDADELQLIAARAHHFRRWTRPRSDFPEGRAGYLRWRTAAKKFHADEVAALLAEEGYTPDEIDRVAAIIRKEGITRGAGAPSDPAAQVHEDALCLVFLETQLSDIAGRLGEDETVAVLVKTLPKMSPEGVAAAGRLELDDWSRELLGRAAAGDQ